jgi:hypothetical protein
MVNAAQSAFPILRPAIEHWCEKDWKNDLMK